MCGWHLSCSCFASNWFQNEAWRLGRCGHGHGSMPELVCKQGQHWRTNLGHPLWLGQLLLVQRLWNYHDPDHDVLAEPLLHGQVLWHPSSDH